MNKKTLYPILVLTIGLGLAALIGTEYLSISSQGSIQRRSQSELIPEVTGRVTSMSDALVSGGSVYAILAHLLFGRDLAFFSLLRIFALAGVVVNSSLVLVGYINRQRRVGQPLSRAVSHAG